MHIIYQVIPERIRSDLRCYKIPSITITTLRKVYATRLQALTKLPWVLLNSVSAPLSTGRAVKGDGCPLLSERSVEGRFRQPAIYKVSNFNHRDFFEQFLGQLPSFSCLSAIWFVSPRSVQGSSAACLLALQSQEHRTSYLYTRYQVHNNSFQADIPRCFAQQSTTTSSQRPRLSLTGTSASSFSDSQLLLLCVLFVCVDLSQGALLVLQLLP